MTILQITDIIGTSAFAISALFLYKQYKFDLLGLLIIAILTALGGGVIRSLLLNETPQILIDNTSILIVIVSLFLGYIIKIKRSFEDRISFLVLDAVGLVSFSITGASIAITHNLEYFGVIFIAMISAVGGGLLRDLLLNRIPVLLTGGFYGMVSIIIGTIFYFFNDINIIFVFVVGLILRLIAIKYKWKVSI